MAKPLLLGQTYLPPKGEHRLDNVGDLVNARKVFFEQKPNNLYYLLEKRYAWMNAHIDAKKHRGMEVGCGAGFSKEFIDCDDFLLTDYADFDWLDKKVNALDMHNIESESMDFVISSNMIHHLANPHRFFSETARVLRSGGKLLIQEVYGSFLLRFLLKALKHEGYSYEVDVFDPEEECCDPEQLWAGNNVIPNLLFEDMQRFEQHFPFKTLKKRYCECLIFLASGGVTAKTKTIQLPRFLLSALNGLDNALVFLARKTFALQMQLVLEVRK